MQSKPKNRIVVLAFQLCVIADSVFGSDAALYRVSKMVMLLFFVVMAFLVLLRNFKLRVGRQICLPVAFALYMLTSVLWSYNRTVATYQLITELQLMLLLLFVYLVMLNGAEVKDYLDALYVAGWGMAIFALVRYGGLTNYLEVMGDGDRMGGEIANENSFGLVFSNAALAAAYYLVIRKRKIDIFSIAVFAFFALSSGSKKAALLIVVGIFAIALVHYGFKQLYKTILAGAVVLVFAWYVLQLPLFETVYMRLESFLSGELDKSDAGRMYMISLGLEMFWDRPILGYGLNNYRLFNPWGLYSHNNFVELLFSGGLVGFVLYYLMYLSPLCVIFLRKPKKEKLPEQYLMLLVWIVIDLVFGYGMVQIYEKTSFILLGVALGTTDKNNMQMSVKQNTTLEQLAQRGIRE